MTIYNDLEKIACAVGNIYLGSGPIAKRLGEEYDSFDAPLKLVHWDHLLKEAPEEIKSDISAYRKFHEDQKSKLEKEKKVYKEQYGHSCNPEIHTIGKVVARCRKNVREACQHLLNIHNFHISNPKP